MNYIVVKVFGAFFLMIAALSCDGSILPEQCDELVVEGWIEDNEFPVVLLSRTINIRKEYQPMDSISEYIVKWAKVTVSDGEQSVVLTGKYDKGYFPPYIYTTSRFRGKAGKSYTLTVDYLDYHATATTSIPEPQPIDELIVEKCASSDTLYQISLRFKDDVSCQNYYQIFTRVGMKKHQYLAAYFGTIDNQVLQPSTKIPVLKGRDATIKKYTPYYSIDDSVAVKLAHIDDEAYKFWYDYSRNLSTADNMFFATQSNIRFNVKGGIGYWCGMGSTIKYVCIRDSVK